MESKIPQYNTRIQLPKSKDLSGANYEGTLLFILEHCYLRNLIYTDVFLHDRLKRLDISVLDS